MVLSLLVLVSEPSVAIVGTTKRVGHYEVDCVAIGSALLAIHGVSELSFVYRLRLVFLKLMSMEKRIATRKHAF